jgi:NADH-quinone oxidoreductase subunit G
MNHVGTICAHCGDGCKTTLGVRNGEIIRANNRDRSGINGEFLCIKGRYGFDFNAHPERLTSPLIRVDGKLQPASWALALRAVASRFVEIIARGGKFGVIGSNHSTNEENFFLQKFARHVLGTSNLDHRRTGDIITLLDALQGRAGALATAADLYTTPAALVISSDLSEQHPFLAWQLRANFRHNRGKVFAITPGPVREDGYAAKTMRAEEGSELEAVESFREQLAAAPSLVILFGDSIKGDAVRRLVAFGDSLGIPVKYVCLVDDSNSRGAADMGLAPDLLPGYRSVREIGLEPGLAYGEILAATDLDALYVIGENPLASHPLASGPFLVVQDMFLTATAARADVILPSASAYEKSGTVTNTTGEIQKLTAGPTTMGTKSDLEIIGLIAKEMGTTIGVWRPDDVLKEIRQSVPFYQAPPAIIETGGASPTEPTASMKGPISGNVLSHLILSARNTLFLSGTLGRYSKTLNSVLEYPGKLYGKPVHPAHEREGAAEPTR